MLRVGGGVLCAPVSDGGEALSAVEEDQRVAIGALIGKTWQFRAASAASDLVVDQVANKASGNPDEARIAGNA